MSTRKVAKSTDTGRKRCLIYTRVSLDATGEGRSNSRQLDRCKALAAYRGWDVVYVMQETGSALKKRPVWDQVLLLIEQGKVDVVVAWHIDRMMRSMLDLEQLITIATDKNVGIATATGDIDLTSDVGRMVARILAAVARAEVDRKGARQRLANEQRAKEGRPHFGGVVPFGYERDYLTIITHEADAIRSAATAVLGGTPIQQIVQAWESLGLASSRSAKAKGGWTTRGVRNVLLNPRYAGIRVYQGVEIGKASWDPILTLDTHLALKRVLTDGARLKGQVNTGRTPTTLLTGIARCNVCDDTLKGSSTHDKSLRYECKKHCLLVPRDVVDEYVTGWVLDMVGQPDILTRLASSGHDEVDKARLQVVMLEERLTGLADSYADGLITRAQLESGSATIREHLEQAHNILAVSATDARLTVLLGGGDVQARWAEMPLGERRAVIDALLSVKVQPCGRSASKDYDPALKVQITEKVAVAA